MNKTFFQLIKTSISLKVFVLMILCMIGCQHHKMEPNKNKHIYQSCTLYAIPRLDNIERHSFLTANKFPYKNQLEYTKNRFLYYLPIPEDSFCISFHGVINDTLQMSRINSLIQSCITTVSLPYNSSHVKMVAFLNPMDNKFPDTLCIYDDLNLTINGKRFQCTPLIVELIKMLPRSLERNWIEQYDMSIDTATNNKNLVLLRINKIDTIDILKAYYR
jgi:hypothetical protein